MDLDLDDFESQCFQILYENKKISVFENWLYEHLDLENRVGADIFLELISLDYRNSGARYELAKIINKCVDRGKLKAAFVLRLLRRARESRSELPFILMMFYEMYCKGNYFLQDLGLGYGLSCAVPLQKYQVNY